MTLIETMVAMTAIIVVLMPLTNLYLQTKQLAKSSISEMQAAYRAQSILEELKAKDYETVISTGNWIELDGGKYKIAVTKKNDQLKEVTVTFQYPDAARSKTVSLTMYKAKR